jgi:hypothetical protein
LAASLNLKSADPEVLNKEKETKIAELQALVATLKLQTSYLTALTQHLAPFCPPETLLTIETQTLCLHAGSLHSALQLSPGALSLQQKVAQDTRRQILKFELQLADLVKQLKSKEERILGLEARI